MPLLQCLFRRGRNLFQVKNLVYIIHGNFGFSFVYSLLLKCKYSNIVINSKQTILKARQILTVEGISFQCFTVWSTHKYAVQYLYNIFVFLGVFLMEFTANDAHGDFRMYICGKNTIAKSQTLRGNMSSSGQ